MKIKGVVWERRSETVKEQVGDSLYTERTPDQQDEVRAETVWNYLDVIEMYTLGLAIVGAKAIEPPPTKAETMELDPSDYVVFPYQFSVDYTHRANTFVKAALKVHTPTQVFDMLRERDRGERQEWVQKIRTETTSALGKIYKEVAASRREDWKFKDTKP